MLFLIACAESGSEHPLGRALLKHAALRLDLRLEASLEGPEVGDGAAGRAAAALAAARGDEVSAAGCRRRGWNGVGQDQDPPGPASTLWV